MEASVKFNILEDIGYPNVEVKDRQTPDVSLKASAYSSLCTDDMYSDYQDYGKFGCNGIFRHFCQI
jgi:hypothetical protein